MTDPDAAYAARLMAETDEGLATGVMGWVRWATTVFEPELREQDYVDWWAEADILDCDNREGGERLIRLVDDWHPSSDWADWGLVFARVSTPTPDGHQLVRQLRVVGPSSEGSWTSTATASDGNAYNGFGPTPLAAKCDATLKAARGRKAVLERQAELARRQVERLARLDEPKGRGKS